MRMLDQNSKQGASPRCKDSVPFVILTGIILDFNKKLLNHIKKVKNLVYKSQKKFRPSQNQYMEMV